MKWKIPLSDLDFGIEEEKAVGLVLKNKWLTMGAVTSDFELKFAEYHHCSGAVAVSSCTAALHLACLVLGIGPGDEVILPSLTFVATANAVRYVGATPVFADIKSENDLNISLENIRKKLSSRTKAIIVMHYAGYSCDMEEIVKFAKEEKLFVIEDAAHALGGELLNKKLGTWGDIGCFSFFSNKNLVTGEGGMIIAKDPEITEKLKQLRSHGMTSLTWDRHQGHAWSYDVVDLGFNYRLDEIRSALGRVQLEKLNRNNKRRREIVYYYREMLSSIHPDVVVPFSDHPGLTAAHIMPIILPKEIDRQSFIVSMKNAGIQTSMHYPPIYNFTAYKSLGYTGEGLEITQSVAEREVTLPLFPKMTIEDVKIIGNEIKIGLEQSQKVN